MEMPYSDLLDYYYSIPQLNGRERVEEMQVSIYPNLNSSSRSELWDFFYKKAYPPEEISTKELAMKLKGLTRGR